jgi:hypothetical protein
MYLSYLFIILLDKTSFGILIIFIQTKNKKMLTRKLLEVNNGLQEAAGCGLKKSESLNIAKNIILIERHITEYEKIYKAFVDTYGKKNEKGEFYFSGRQLLYENPKEADVALEEIKNREVDFSPLTFEMTDECLEKLPTTALVSLLGTVILEKQAAEKQKE